MTFGTYILLTLSGGLVVLKLALMALALALLVHGLFAARPLRIPVTASSRSRRALRHGPHH